MKLTTSRIAELAKAARLAISEEDAKLYVGPVSQLLDEFEATARNFESSGPAPACSLRIAASEAASSSAAFIHRFDLPPTGSGRLDGLTIGIKDTIAIAGVPRTRGRRSGWDWPAEDATIVSRIRAAGGHIVGTLNLDAWSASATGEGSEFGIIDNPRAPGHLTGGSSSGAGAALAANLIDLAIGTDTAGSARIPASWCGVVALKPSHSAIPANGILGLDPSLDDVCPMARTIEECATLFGVLADPASPNVGPSRRVGVIGGLETGYDECGQAATDEALARFRRAGWTVVPVSVPLWSMAWTIESMLLATSVPHLARTGWQGRWLDRLAVPIAWDERPPQLIALWILASEELRDRANEYYGIAQAERDRLRKQVQSAFDLVDVILTPTTPTPAPQRAPLKRDSLLATASGAATPVTTSTLTTPANLTGIPALAIPMGKSTHGLPGSIQLHAPLGLDYRLFDVAKEIET